MATRTPPTHDEIVTVLETDKSRYTGPNLPVGMGGILWDNAVEHLRKGLRTVEVKAREWLIDAATDGTSPIAAIWSGSGKFLTRDGVPESRLTDIGWSSGDVQDLQFGNYGQIVLPNASRYGTQSGLFIVRRDQIEPMRQAVTDARAEVDRERGEQDAAELAEFRELHGDALDVIEPIVKSIPFENWAEDELVKPRIYKGWAKLFGDPGTLTITVRGSQIEALAEVLKNLNH
jgi:hypothetical protein